LDFGYLVAMLRKDAVRREKRGRCGDVEAGVVDE
jgi:hypothetical protein